MKEFFDKNKVLIIGLLSAIALPVYELLKNGETSTKVLVMSGAVALTSYLARNLRGQWATIAGAVGTMLATYIIQDQTGLPISWAQIIMQGLVLLLAASAPPPKSRGYESTAIIMEAKKEGEIAVPTPAPPPTETK